MALTVPTPRILTVRSSRARGGPHAERPPAALAARVRVRRGRAPPPQAAPRRRPSGCSATFGFDEGVAGHITARDPELDDHFWVNPFGMSFKQIKVKDLILVNHQGEVVEGNWPVNQAAFAIHSAIHAARPDVIAAAHSHSVYGKTLSSLHTELLPLTQDACAFYDDHALFDDFTGVVLDTEEGKRIAHALGEKKAAILVNHGLLTVGQQRRRGGVVVHHHGALVPGPAPGHGRRHAEAHRARDRHPHRRGRSAPTSPAGCRSSPSTTGSPQPQPDLFEE